MKKIIILASFLFLVSCGVNKENISNSGSLENNSGKVEISTGNISETGTSTTQTGTLENPLSSSYENYQKRARDTKRIMDLNILEVMAFSYFAENDKYPEKIEDLENYGKIPKDPTLDGKIVDGCEFGYKYELEGEKYRFSTCLENDLEQAKNDGGIYENKYEKFSPEEEKNSEN